MTPERIAEIRKQTLERHDALLHECVDEIERLQKELQEMRSSVMTRFERGLRRALLKGSCRQTGCRVERFRTKTGTVCANGHVEENDGDPACLICGDIFSPDDVVAVLFHEHSGG